MFYEAHSHDLRIFASPDWLNITCANWDVLQVNIEQEQYFFVYQIENRLGSQWLRNPILSPYTLVQSSHSNQTHILAAIETFIKTVPHALVDIDLDYKFNFASTSLLQQAHTNVLQLAASEEQLYGNIHDSLQRQIKKAQKKITIQAADDIDSAYDLLALSYTQKGKDYPYDKEKIKELYNYCQQNDFGTILIAYDGTTAVGAAFFVWDKLSAYYLGGGRKEGYSEVSTALLWHGIIHAKKLEIPLFDFEGSSIASIDKFFKKFGAEQRTYFKLSSASTVAKVAQTVNKFFRKQ
ncbi:MAG: hypothetical protein RL660_2864 [Bacteroidota bacterium]|jgi:hypothetical protein